MSEARESLVGLLHAIDRVHRTYPAVVLHAPAHEAGWAPLIDLALLTAEQTERVVARMDARDVWSVDLPALTPDLSRNLAERIKIRREAKQRDAVIRDWQRSRAHAPSSSMRPH